MTSRKHFKPKPKDILQRYAALVSASTDQHDYQWQLRLLQSLWRKERGFPIGEYRGNPSGNRLVMPEAKETLNNYLTPTIRKVVRREVEGPKRRGKSFQPPRIYDNLLSSQPLCFNLFGELAKDRALASQVLSDISKGQVAQVEMDAARYELVDAVHELNSAYAALPAWPPAKD